MARCSDASARVVEIALFVSERTSCRLSTRGKKTDEFRPAARRARRFACLAGLICLLACGCERSAPAERVIVYTSVDQEFAEAILARFEQQTGVDVQPVFDSEAGKTTGLVRRLFAERAAPRCDVWWSGEIFGTIELARADALAAYVSPAAADLPSGWSDRDGRWTGVAARARVLAFDTRHAKAEDLPRTWRELSEPRWASQLALANPQFGTTRGHVAAMFARYGEAETRRWLQAFRDAGAQLADGNGHAVRLLAAGSARIAMTDTDDVWVAQSRGQPVDLVYPALDVGQPPVWIPCTVALMRGAPNSANGRRLVDFLVSAACEEALARSTSRNVPLRSTIRDTVGYTGPIPQPLDWEAAADALQPSAAAARDILLR